MSFNQDLRDTTIQARVGIVVYLNLAQDQFKLRQFGDIVYFSKRKKYCLIYVNKNVAEQVVIKLNRLHFVKKAELSPTESLDFSREHEEQLMKTLAEQAEKMIAENGDFKHENNRW
ncbi:YlbG family protein [Lactobacillus psittaci]|uniref:Uncharacterized protein n=1 Tax=Lactobacillus psittaci DSM 15354 TaxID=1122152 RepID=A0A0R1S338_9LACO|nr:YlbG family protein [Lactobacillus psittaci]KRL63495.1 hypothetical protein FC23_GL000737 [Lactobacillus psittaci DSM 15354]